MNKPNKYSNVDKCNSYSSPLYSQSLNRTKNSTTSPEMTLPFFHSAIGNMHHSAFLPSKNSFAFFPDKPLQVKASLRYN